MKYLIKRDDFLRSAKSAESNSDFIRKGRMHRTDVMNEEATGGPFENDLGWGDSLLGRLINSGIRKAKISYSAKKIDSCLKDLKTVLDSMIAGCVKEEIFDDMNLVRLKKYFTDIEAICISTDAEEEKLDKLIGGHEDLWDEEKKWNEQLDGGLLVETCEFIDKEVSEETCKKFIASKTKADIIKELGVFIDDLRKMTSKKDSTNDEGEESEADSSNDGILEPNEAEKLGTMYPTMLRNLQALNLILANYKKVNLSGNVKPKGNETKEESELLQIGKEYIYTNKNGVKNKVKLISLTHNIKIGDDKKWLTKDDKEIDTLKKGYVSVVYKDKSGEYTFKSPEMAVPKSQLSAIKESLFLLEEATIGEGGGKDRHKVGTGESHLTQAYNKLKKDIEVLESSKEKGIAIDLKLLGELISNSKNTQSKDLIKSLYNEINRYLVGDKKQTIQEKDPLYKESYEYLMPKTANNPNGGKMQVTAEKIARFAKRALQFDGENLYGGLGDLSNPLKEFVDTMKELMKRPIVKEGQPKKEEANEKSIFKYDRFISHTKENELNFILEDSDYEEEVLKYWESFKVRLGLKESDYKITKEEHDKLDGNLQKNLEDKNSGMVYDASKNADPIIAIARIYKRAHDLYYTPVIPSGRSGGRVSNKTFREYEHLGNSPGTPDAPGYGWASRAVRQKWTDGVMEILQDQKYRKILANIKFIVPGSEDTFNKESLQSVLKDAYMILEAEGKKSHGLILFDFMNDLLSDEVAANFDKQRQVLMRKYFGSEGEKAEETATKKQAVIASPNKEISDSEKDAKTIMWKDAQTITAKEGQFHVLPIDGNHKMIFIHLLKRMDIDVKDSDGKAVKKGFFLIKFTFDEALITKKYIEETLKGYTMVEDWSDGSAINVYYGLIDEKSLNTRKKSFEIVYFDYNTNKAITSKFELRTGAQNGMGKTSKGVKVSCAYLVKIDNKKKETIIEAKDFKSVVKNEPAEFKSLDELKQEAAK